MSKLFEPVTANVFLFRDTCNVFIIRDGRTGILIDYGSGKVLSALTKIGIDRVGAILHTHHHRDQAQGDSSAVEAGIPIFVPRHERHLFDQTELYWSTKQLYDMVNVRNTYFSLTQSVPVTGILEDFDEFCLDEFRLQILPTPGHTVGSITLLCEIDARSVAFTGDLLHSPGKVHTLFDMQFSYAALDGVEAAALSLSLLREKAPEILCPSHGGVMFDAEKALSLTETNLRSYFRMLSGGKPLVDEYDFTRVNSRLLFASYANSSFYVILSRNGKRALFVDYGAANDSQFSPSTLRSEPGDTVRFFPHSVRRLKTQYGIETIEAVILTHCHDDHLCGVPYLRKQLGAEVWALDVMKKILENPTAELAGCVFPDPIPVARVLKDGERISWEGLELDVYHTPGHSEYHMSMFTEIEGKCIAFSGDNVWRPDFVPNIIYRNRVGRESHQVTAKLYRERKPEVLCTGHGLVTDVPPENFDTFYKNSKRLTEHFEMLLPTGSGIAGIEPAWIRIVPYQFPVRSGSTTTVAVQIHNPLENIAEISYRWVLPSGWIAAPAERKEALAPEEISNQKTGISVPDAFKNRFPKQAICHCKRSDRTGTKAH